MGPITSYKWDDNPYRSRVITPVTLLSSAIYRGTTTFITGDGAECVPPQRYPQCQHSRFTKCLYHQSIKIEWDRIPTDPSVKCDRAIRYPGLLGVRETWVLWVRFLGTNLSLDEFYLQVLATWTCSPVTPDFNWGDERRVSWGEISHLQYGERPLCVPKPCCGG